MRLEPPRWWYHGRIPMLAYALYPASLAYGSGIKRRFAKTTPYRSTLPVICIGNFTVGGAGKTPLALKVAALLVGMGRKPGFLTRGFGGSERGPHRVDLAADTAARVGDEPLLLAQACDTVVSRDRPAGAQLLETLGADVIVMDDGFQNPTLHKDFSLVVIDGGVGLGSGRVFPLGPLRAPLDFQVGLASAIVVVGGNRSHRSIIPDLRMPVLQAIIEPSAELGAFSGRWLAFCGIGRPSKFYDTLCAAGVDVVSTLSFPDHHNFTPKDARALQAIAKAFDATLLTTEKDRTRLHGATGDLNDLYLNATAFPIGLRFEAADESSLISLMREVIDSFGIQSRET